MVDKKFFEKETEKKVKEGSTKLYPVSNKDIDIIKGDSSESGSNSYAKATQAAVKSLSKKLYPVSDKDIETLKD
jgi:hypothetical protein